MGVIRCNWCDHICTENDLIIKDDIEYCPKCKRDGCLMDIDEHTIDKNECINNKKRYNKMNSTLKNCAIKSIAEFIITGNPLIDEETVKTFWENLIETDIKKAYEIFYDSCKDCDSALDTLFETALDSLYDIVLEEDIF